MKKILLTIIGLAMASPAWSSQTAVTEISGIQPSVGALKTQVNAKLGTVESNRQDHETRVAAMETGKAAVSCFANAAAFNACFSLDWQSVDASGFNGNLTTTDDTLQEIAQKVDDLALGSGGATTAIDDLTDVDTTGKAAGKILKFDASGNLVVGDDSTGSGSVPSGTVNGQVLLWATNQWAASTAPWVTTASLGTGVGTWLATPSGANLASALTSALPASKGGTGLTSLGTGVGTALAAAVDGTGGLASKASLDALPNIIFGTGLTVSEDTPSAGTDTISVTANTYQSYDANMIAWPSTISATEVGYLNGLTEALSTSLAGKQAADADLTTVAGATGAGNSKYFGTNSSGTAGFYDLPSGGSGSFTFDTFPAYEDSAHSSGIAVNGTTLAIYSQTAGKWLTVGLTDTLNATPATYTLTIDGTDWNGTDLVSVGGSTYTADGTKTGLSGTVSITVTPDTGREATCSGTGITGSSSPYSADMSTDRTIACTFSGGGISDNFSTDTSANYTALAGTITVSGGAVHGSSWSVTKVYHETSTGSSNTFAQADCAVINGDGNGCSVVASFGGTTDGLTFQITGQGAVVVDNSGTYVNGDSIANATGTYTIRLEVTPTAYVAKVNGVTRLTGSHSHPVGQYVGFGIKRDISATDNTIDNFSGGVL